MSVSLICPHCGTPATIHRPPLSVCPQCQTAWPQPLRLSAEAALAREKVTRPTLLTVGMYLALPFGAIFLLLLLLAPFNAGNYTINGESVTGIEFLRRAGVMFGVESVAALAAAYGHFGRPHTLRTHVRRAVVLAALMMSAARSHAQLPDTGYSHRALSRFLVVLHSDTRLPDSLRDRK